MEVDHAGRATSTEQGARCATRSLTLPRARAPVSPLLPNTTSDTPSAAAAWRISSAGVPWVGITVGSTPSSAVSSTASRAVRVGSPAGVGGGGQQVQVRPVAVSDARRKHDGAAGVLGAIGRYEDPAWEGPVGRPTRDEHGHACAVHCKACRVAERDAPGPRADVARDHEQVRARRLVEQELAPIVSREDLPGGLDACLTRRQHRLVDRLVRALGGDRRLTHGARAALLADAYEDQRRPRTGEGDGLLDGHVRAAAPVDAPHTMRPNGGGSSWPAVIPQS